MNSFLSRRQRSQQQETEILIAAPICIIEDLMTYMAQPLAGQLQYNPGMVPEPVLLHTGEPR